MSARPSKLRCIASYSRIVEHIQLFSPDCCRQRLRAGNGNEPTPRRGPYLPTVKPQKGVVELNRMQTGNVNRNHRTAQHRILGVLTLLVGINGCVTRTGFPGQAAEATCDKIQDCTGDLGLKVLGYSDFDECVDGIADGYEEIVEECDDWDSHVAAQCVDKIESQACLEINTNNDPCEDLWDICD